MIFTPAMAAAALMIMPELSSLVGKLTGKEKEGEILGTILSLPGMAAGVLGKSPSIAKTTTSTEGSGLQIGGAVGKTADYTSKMPGVQGFGKGKSIFDPNFNTNQLGIQSPYNNTPDYLNFLGG